MNGTREAEINSFPASLGRLDEFEEFRERELFDGGQTPLGDGTAYARTWNYGWGLGVVYEFILVGNADIPVTINVDLSGNCWQPDNRRRPASLRNLEMLAGVQ